MTVKGIDISRAQEVFDFEAAKAAGVKFVIIRAGIGTDTDTYFRRNLAECKRLGLPFGFYWYFKALSDTQFAAELAACTKAVKGEKPEYPIFCDIEEQKQIELLTPKQRTDWALKFCEQMTENGLPSGVYANPSWMENYYDKSRLDGIDIWLAHWTESPDLQSKYDYGQTMWQWGVDNIGGKDVDGDICFINYPAKTDYWYKTHGVNTAEPDVKPSEPTTSIAKLYKAGDAVRLENTALYGSSTTSQPANHLTGTYYIHTADDVINGRIRITTPKGCKDCTGWVDVSDIDKPDTAEISSDNNLAEFKSGDIVRIKNGAKSYDGISLSNWVYTKRFYVASVTKDRVLLNKSPDDAVFAINTPFNKSDLIKC